MADSLVFDFPDPTPHFDFDNFSHHGGGSTEGLSNSSNREGDAAAAIVVSSSSLKKNSSKKSRTLFKSRFMNKGKSQQQQQRPASPVPSTRSLHHHTNNGDDSPLNKSMGDQSGTTATTASLSVGSGSFSPTRLQYGDNNHHANSSSPKPSSSSSAAPSLSNGNNISGSQSPRFEFTLFDDSPSPKSHSGMRKTWTNNTKQQPQQPNPYSNLTATTTSSTNNNQPISSLSYGDNNNNNLYTTYGLSSDRTAASGYFSEVSEFSFDRVTVTTERTGMSSNVSWNFMEGNHSNHLIDDDDGGILGVLGTSNGASSSNNVLSEIDNLLLDDDLLRDGPHHNHVNGNRMNVFTGEIHERCDQSVISEISEGIDGHDDQGGGDGNGMDFINSLLLEKYEDGDIIQHRQQYDGKGMMVPSLRPRPSSPTMHHSSREQQQQQQQQLQHSGKSATNTAAAPLQKQSSSNNNTISTVSTSATNSGGGLTSVESTSGKYKQQQQQQQQQRSNNSTKGNKPTETKRSIFKAIIEDIQFCGMYFCGLDTTVEDDGQLTDNKKDLLRGGGSSPGDGKSKKARAKEMDSTFLGKFVNCANYGPDV